MIVGALERLDVQLVNRRGHADLSKVAAADGSALHQGGPVGNLVADTGPITD